MQQALKILCAGIVVALSLGAPTKALAQDTASVVIKLQISSGWMVVNGVNRQIDELGSRVTIVEGRTMVPIRPIMEALGGTVNWDPELKLLTIRDNLGEHEIILQVNSFDSVVNAQTGPRLEVAPIMPENVAMVPISFVAEHLGYYTSWNATTRTITISTSPL